MVNVCIASIRICLGGGGGGKVSLFLKHNVIFKDSIYNIQVSYSK